MCRYRQESLHIQLINSHIVPEEEPIGTIVDFTIQEDMDMIRALFQILIHRMLDTRMEL